MIGTVRGRGARWLLWLLALAVLTVMLSMFPEIRRRLPFVRQEPEPGRPADDRG